MRSRIGVTKGLELANGLAEAIRDFSERDQKAAKEMRAKTFAAKRAFERESGAEKESLEASLAMRQGWSGLRKLFPLAGVNCRSGLRLFGVRQPLTFR